VVAAIPPKLPIVEIRQTYAKIGIDADLGTQTIRQPRPTMEMRREPPAVFIEQPRGELIIDQTRAWDALAIGGHLEMMLRIYRQGPEIALETIGKIAENGDRLAAIHLEGNPIADIAAEESQVEFSEYQFAGPAGFDNVDIAYRANKPIIEVRPGKQHIFVQVNPPIHIYERGKLLIYMRQYNKVEFYPPKIDIAV